MKNRSLFLLSSSIILITLIGGCGNNFGQKDGPQIQLNSTSLDIPMLHGSDQKMGFEIKNVGKTALNVNGIQLKNLPASNRIKWDGGKPAAFTVQPQKSESKQLVVSGTPFDIKCEPAPSDVPPAYKKNYCGEIIIRSNSISSGNQNNGEKHIYLQYKGGKGVASLNPSSGKIQAPLKNQTYTTTFNVHNDGENELQVNSITADDDISGALTILPNQFKVAAGAFQSVIITYKPTADDQLAKRDVKIKVNTSASGQDKTFYYTISDKKPDYENIQLSTTYLEFQSTDEQTFTITNNGEGKALTISNIYFENNALNNTYVLEDTDASKTVPLSKSTPSGIIIPAKATKTFKLSFAASATNKESAQGILKMKILNSQTDSIPMNTSLNAQIVVFGKNAASAYVQRYPNSIQLNNIRDEKRSLVLYNLGKDDASIDKNTFNPDTSELSVVDESGNDISWPLTIPSNTITRVYYKRTGTGAISTRSQLELGNDISKFKDDTKISNSVSITATNASQANSAKIEVVSGSDKAFQGRAYVLKLKDLQDADSTSCTWTLTKRPTGSQLFFSYSSCKSNISIVPDMVGDYEVVVDVYRSGGSSAEIAQPFTVQ